MITVIARQVLSELSHIFDYKVLLQMCFPCNTTVLDDNRLLVPITNQNMSNAASSAASSVISNIAEDRKVDDNEDIDGSSDDEPIMPSMYTR